MTYSDKTHGAGRLGAIVGHESFRTENGASFSQICDKEMLRKHDHQRNGQFDNLTSEIISSFRENLQQVFATRQAQHLSMTARCEATCPRNFVANFSQSDPTKDDWMRKFQEEKLYKHCFVLTQFHV